MDRFYLKYKGLYHCIKGCCMKLDSGSKKCRCAQQSIEYAPPAAKYLASDTLSVNPMIPDHMFISPLVIMNVFVCLCLNTQQGKAVCENYREISLIPSHLHV